MKTQLGANTVKATLIISLILATFSIYVAAQPRNEVQSESADRHATKLDNIIKNTDEEIKYRAPDEETSAIEVEKAIAELDLVAGKLDAGLKYYAPDDPENENHQNLENITKEVVAELKYKAPEYADESFGQDIATLKRVERNSKPVKVEIFNARNQWLISAGYMKSEKTPAWEKVKKVFGSKDSVREYANEY